MQITKRYEVRGQTTIEGNPISIIIEVGPDNYGLLVLEDRQYSITHDDIRGFLELFEEAEAIVHNLASGNSLA